MALYKRPGSKYHWMKFTFDGELVQQSTKCTSKVKAREVEAAFRHELVLGRIGIKPKKDAPTFDKAVEDFLKWSKVEHSSQPATYRRYYFSCECLKKYFGKVKANRIDTKDIEKFIGWRSGQTSRKTKEPITRRTINYDLFVLKMIFKRLSDGKLISDNPARLVKTLSEDENKFHVLSRDEERKYLLAGSPQLSDVAALMLETGMRCGEVYQLRRQDVFLEKGFLKVVKGKTKSSVRRVHLTERAQGILTTRINRFENENLFPQNDMDGARAVVSLNNPHLKAVRSLGFSFRLYDCRHTFATRALESGVDLLTLASILGHSNLKMVSRYAHPSEQHKADAIRRMGNVRVEKKAKAV